MSIHNEADRSKWTKDGRHWYFRCYYNDIDGKRKEKISKMFKSREIAEEEELLFKSKREDQTKIKFEIVALAFFEYMYKTRKESTVYSYEIDYNKHIKSYFKMKDISKIKIADINKWKEEVEKKDYALAYLNKLYTILQSIFKFAITNYGLTTNPVTNAGRFQRKNDEVIKDEEKLRYIVYDEFTTFISVIEDIKWNTFFTFLYYTGMRKGEIQALTWKDVDFINNLIVVNKTLSVKVKGGGFKITNTKNKKNRKVKMSKVLSNSLKKYKEYLKNTYSNFNENWFVFGCNRFLPQTTIDNKKHYYFKLSGINEITIHEFRHSHVSLCINEYIKKCENLNIQIDTYKFFIMMSDRMGHTIKEMIKTYLHLFPTIQDEVINLLDNL